MNESRKDVQAVSRPVTKQTDSGSDQLLAATDNGTINLGKVRRDTGFFTGRITVTVAAGDLDELDIGWGFASKARTLPIWIDNVSADFDTPNFIQAKTLTSAEITSGTQYNFVLGNPSNPVPLPLIPEDEDLIIYLNHANGTGSDDFTVAVEMDYESYTDQQDGSND